MSTTVHMVKPRLGLTQAHLAVKRVAQSLPEPSLPLWPSVGVSLGQHTGGSILGCSPGGHICCDQDPIDAGLKLGQGSKAFFLSRIRGEWGWGSDHLSQ